MLCFRCRVRVTDLAIFHYKFGLSAPNCAYYQLVTSRGQVCFCFSCFLVYQTTAKNDEKVCYGF